ncbi:MAG: hypothetical protein AAGA56_07190 [Myxococcota bacterium]
MVRAFEFLKFRRPAAGLAFSLSIAPALAAAGCGHSATREECEVIFRKSAELAAKSHDIKDPAEVERLVAQALSDKRDKLEGCVGRRVTDEVLKCVPGATSEEELEACLE